MALHMKHLGASTRTTVKVIGADCPDAQYNYKALEMRVTVTGTRRGAQVIYVVSGRAEGKPFEHTLHTYDSAIDKFNSILLP